MMFFGTFDLLPDELTVVVLPVVPASERCALEAGSEAVLVSGALGCSSVSADLSDLQLDVSYST